MTSEAAAARRLALAFEAKKISYRQTKEGEVISFLLHPNDRPVDLLNAPLGQRYQVAAVALNDDDTPKEVMQHSRLARPNNGSEHNAQPASSPARAKRSWDEMSPAQQAGVLCADKSFQKFCGARNEATAAEWVRQVIGVGSRADIIRNSINDASWQELVTEYRAWMRKPSVVPA